MLGKALMPLILLTLPLLSGCSIPKIIVLHDPLSAEEHLRLGSIYETQGKPDLARDQYRMAAEQDPKNLKAWRLLGDLASSLDDLKQAEKAYAKALDLDPRSGDLHNNLAWVYAKRDRRLGRARELVERALELTPEHRPYYLDTLGVLQLKQGKPEEAVASLAEAVSTIPESRHEMLAEAYGHLADALAAAGRAEEANTARERSEQMRKRTAPATGPTERTVSP